MNKTSIAIAATAFITSAAAFAQSPGPATPNLPSAADTPLSTTGPNNTSGNNTSGSSANGILRSGDRSNNSGTSGVSGTDRITGATERTNQGNDRNRSGSNRASGTRDRLANERNRGRTGDGENSPSATARGTLKNGDTTQGVSATMGRDGAAVKPETSNNSDENSGRGENSQSGMGATGSVEVQPGSSTENRSSSNRSNNRSSSNRSSSSDRNNAGR